MVKSYLDFEQPIADIESKILELENSDLDQDQINTIQVEDQMGL